MNFRGTLLPNRISKKFHLFRIMFHQCLCNIILFLKLFTVICRNIHCNMNGITWPHIKHITSSKSYSRNQFKRSLSYILETSHKTHPSNFSIFGFILKRQIVYRNKHYISTFLLGLDLQLLATNYEFSAKIKFGMRK